MSLTLSKIALSISPSATLAIDTRAKELIAAGHDVVNLGVGEPDFDTPGFIREAGKAAIDAGRTRYTAVAGDIELRCAIADKFKRENGLDYDPGSEIIVTSGAKPAIFTALCAILDPGDEVVIPCPCWVSYPEMVRMAGGVPVTALTGAENDFAYTADDIRPYVTEKTKAIIINSPSNPNGSILGRAALESIAALAVERQLYVISDEIYEKLIYDGEEHVSIASLGDMIKRQTIVINGVSKTYAMTGWRIGYAAGPKNVIARMTAYQSHAASGPNSIAQKAAAAAIAAGDVPCVAEMVREFDARRLLMYGMVNAIPGISAARPKGAFYIMADISGVIGSRHNGQLIAGSEDFARLLLENRYVAVVAGRPFGSDRHVRLSYAVSRESITKGMERMAEFVSELYK